MGRRHLSGLFGAVAVAFFLAALAQAAEFSATVVTNSGGEERQSKIYVKGDKIRREFVNPSDTTIFIVPGDKKIMWMLEPKIQTYRKLPFDKDAFTNNLKKPGGKGGSKLVGTETLHGYVTDKYEAMVKTPTGPRQGNIWISQKLEVPIRIESVDKLFVQEYKDIKEGGVDDALFKLPSGYHEKADQSGTHLQVK
jgi:outer membrane lipoprotein-sorting protein